MVWSVWCDVIRCAVICDVMWCEVVWCDVIQWYVMCVVVWCDTIPCDMWCNVPCFVVFCCVVIFCVALRGTVVVTWCRACRFVLLPLCRVVVGCCYCGVFRVSLSLCRVVVSCNCCYGWMCRVVTFASCCCGVAMVGCGLQLCLNYYFVYFVISSSSGWRMVMVRL